MPRLALISRLPIVALSACAAGCSAAPQSDVALQVDTWWGVGSEQKAFNQVTDRFEAAHPGVSIENIDRPTANDARTRAASQLLVGLPPSSFQANIGADLLRWAVVDTEGGATRERRIRPVTDQIDGAPVLDGVPVRAPLMAALKVGPDSPPFGVPINIHRLNVLYYRKVWFDQYNTTHLSAPLNRFTTLCPADLTTATDLEGVRIAVAVGPGYQYTLGHLTFENVLVGISPTSYENVFKGHPSDADWKNVGHALECVQYLSRSFLDSDDTWAAAADRLSQGNADLLVMGDWVNGQIDSSVVDSMPFPGTDPTYVFTADTFPLPIGAPHLKETAEFLRAISDPEIQAEFSRWKGSIPARADAAESLSAEAKQRSDDFDRSNALLATSGFFPPYYPEAELYDALARMTESGAAQGSVDFVLALMQDAEPLLATWQERLAEGPAPPPPVAP